MKKIKKCDGFTLIEILVVIGIIAILATVVLVALNPARQFAQARNSQRTTNVDAILNAIGQNIADNKGAFTCSSAIPTSTALIMKSAAGGYNIAPCLVPTYLSEMPRDPNPGYFYTDTSNYDTGYTVFQNASTSRITISAPTLEPTIASSTVISVTR